MKTLNPFHAQSLKKKAPSTFHWLLAGVLLFPFAHLTHSGEPAKAASGFHQPEGEVRAITAAKWKKIHQVLPADGTLFEGTYLGLGAATNTEYRLHLLQYQQNPDDFVALMENRNRNMAVIGFLKRSIRDGAYDWKQISVTGDQNQLQVNLQKESMYRLKPKWNKERRLEGIELAAVIEIAGSEIVYFGQARAPLMHQNPVAGDYGTSLDKNNHATLMLTLHAKPQADQLWSVEQTGAHGTLGGIAHSHLPGLLEFQQTSTGGYDPEPSGKITKVIVSLDHVQKKWWKTEEHFNQLVVFDTKRECVDSHEETCENVLVAPPYGLFLNSIVVE